MAGKWEQPIAIVMSRFPERSETFILARRRAAASCSIEATAARLAELCATVFAAGGRA